MILWRKVVAKAVFDSTEIAARSFWQQRESIEAMRDVICIF